jgi:hypothetical protein
MSTSQTELTERLERLERAYSRLKRAALVALLLPILGFVYVRTALPKGANQGVASAKVAAHEFDLVDLQGHRRATMGFDKWGEPSIDLYDGEGKARARICLGNQALLDEPLLEFADAQGKARTQLFLQAAGAPGLWLSGTDHSEMSIGFNRLAPMITLLDDTRKFELDLEAAPRYTDGASLVIYNVKQHQAIWKAP